MEPRRRRRPRAEPLVRAALDCLYILVAYVLSVYFACPKDVPLPLALLDKSGYYLVFVIAWCWVAIDQRLWGTHHTEDMGSYVMSGVRAVVVAFVVIVFAMTLLLGRYLEREFLAVFCLLAGTAILVFRVLVQKAIALVRTQGYDVERVLIVGANLRTAHLVNVIQRHAYHGYKIVGFLESDPERIPLLESLGLPCLGGLDSLPAILAKGRIDDVFIISLPVRSRYETILGMARTCELCNVPVHLMADLFPRRIAKSNVMYMDDIPLLSLSAVPEEQAELFLKRALDIFVSSVLLIALAPPMLLTALAIKLDSKGSVLFSQVRVGRNQRRFFMLKFRSMVQDAEEQRAALEEYNEADGPVFKIRGDPRITRLGGFIRKYSIDELPQLINVWAGRMSLVGPRPPLPSEVDGYTWDQRRRLSVKPGMTGLWQVSGRSDVGFKEWVELDLAYIDKWSLWQDFYILAKTFFVVVRGRGAA